MKKFAGVRLKLVSVIEKYQFIESMVMGGISMISKAYAGTKSKLLNLYDPDKPLSYIIYLDANNLYGNSMMQLLSFERLDWINPEKNNLDNYHDDGPIGRFLEADLDYPDELHDLRNDHPLATEKIKVTKEMLSDYQLNVIEHNFFFFGKTQNFFLI